MRLFALALCLSASASAQSGAAFVQQVERAVGVTAEVVTGTTVASEALSAALLDAASATNVATVTQDGIGNQVELSQSGLGNQFGLSVVGDGNVLSLLQLGNDNVFVGDVLGSGNVLGPDALGNASVQQGDGNRYTLVLDGVDNQAHTLRQVGGGNEAVQIVGPGLQPASIEQRGGATVVVERR